jgi:hypothetical protein
MEMFANIVAMIMLVVTVCSVIACVTPTPKRSGWMKKLYSVIDWGALNWWHAKEK